VEKDRPALAALRKNLEMIPLDARVVLPVPVDRALTLLARQGQRFTLVFADPPYEAGLLDPTLRQLADLGLVATGGVVVAEHSSRSAPPPPRRALPERRRGATVTPR